METPEKQVATAVYYSTDKVFPSSSVIPSKGDDTFKEVAEVVLTSSVGSNDG